ncbi:MAG: acyltransferase [Anaerolineales bacterium]
MIRRMLILMGLSIFSVIVFHSAGWGFTAMYSWAERYAGVGTSAEVIGRTLGYYGLNALVQASVFAIPAFLFVSGFFSSTLFAGVESGPSWKRVWPRVIALGIPYLVWTALALGGRVAQGRLGFMAELPIILLTGGATPAYYYVPLLVQLYVLAPLLVRWAREHTARFLGLTAGIQLGIYIRNYAAILWPQSRLVEIAFTFLPKWFFISFVFWFGLGIVAGFRRQAVGRWLGNMRGRVWWIVGLLFFLGYLEWEILGRATNQVWLPHLETLIDGLYSAAIGIAVLGSSSVSKVISDTMTGLGQRSYGIYLAHPLVMEFAARGLYRVAPWTLGQSWLFEILLIGFGLGVPLLLMEVVRRTQARPLYSFLFG